VPRREAALEACRLRCGRSLMTSFAFIFGVLPLVLRSGAGAEMRQALGLAVFSGMLGVTFFGFFSPRCFFTPFGGSATDLGDDPTPSLRRRQCRPTA